MFARILAFAAVALFGWSPLSAQELPPVVQENLQTLVKDCDGKPDVARKGLQSADLNGDGIEDWILDTGELGCEMASFYCGTAGCTLMMFVSSGGTHAVAWEGNAHRWRPIKIKGKPGILFDLHGSACGKVGSASCSQRYVFQGSRLVGVR